MGTKYSKYCNRFDLSTTRSVLLGWPFFCREKKKLRRGWHRITTEGTDNIKYTIIAMALRREHVVGIRTDLSSCKVHVAPFGKSASGLIYPCDNLLVLSDPSGSSGNQSFIETTKPDNILVAYNVSNDGTFLALAENSPSPGSPSGSLVTLYSLSAANNSKSITAKKKKVIQLESDILHVCFVDSTHVLVLGNSPDYNLMLCAENELPSYLERLHKNEWWLHRCRQSDRLLNSPPGRLR